MKITLDLSKLVEEGKLTPADAERLKALARHDTGSLGINILIGFGVIAVAAGAVTLLLTLIELQAAAGGDLRRGCAGARHRAHVDPAGLDRADRADPDRHRRAQFRRRRWWSMRTARCASAIAGDGGLCRLRDHRPLEPA